MNQKFELNLGDMVCHPKAGPLLVIASEAGLVSVLDYATGEVVDDIPIPELTTLQKVSYADEVNLPTCGETPWVVTDSEDRLPNGTLRVVFRAKTHEEASRWISGRPGAEMGRYGLDGPEDAEEEEQERKYVVAHGREVDARGWVLSGAQGSFWTRREVAAFLSEMVGPFSVYEIVPVKFKE